MSLYNFAQVEAKLPGQARGKERKQQAIAVFALLMGAHYSWLALAKASESHPR